MLPSSALLSLLLFFFPLLSRCNKDVLFNLRVSSLTESDLYKHVLSFLPCPRLRLRIWSRETGLAVPSRVSLLISILRLNLVPTYRIPPEFRGGAHSLSVHIMYYECSSTYMYITTMYHDISSTVIMLRQLTADHAK